MSKIFSYASKISELPIAKKISPRAQTKTSQEDLQGFLACQDLAFAAVKEIEKMIQEGWSERQTANLINTYLADHGVKSFFHKAFVWFGDRTRFADVKRTRDFLPSTRVAVAGDVMILDVAPIFRGYTADIGYTSSLGENKDLGKAQKFLQSLRQDLPRLFLENESGADIWHEIENKIQEAGYDNIHALYPFSVLGHRVHRNHSDGYSVNAMNFGWHSYWSFLSRGLFGQLLNQNYQGDKQGLWAIEPHLGGPGFGAKFEEILVVEDGKAWWLSDKK